MARTEDLEKDVRIIRGLLSAFGLEKRIRIAYDEWNLRGWHHPAVDTAPLGDTGSVRVSLPPHAVCILTAKPA